MAKILDLIYRVTDKATPGIKKIKAEQVTLTSELKKAAITGTALVGVAMALKSAWDQTVGPVIAYNKAMKDLSDSTGVAVDDLSRLVQVGGDVGITAEELGKAFEMATKKGFAVSVDSLADLADKTNAMAEPTERAAYLSNIFGKNWAQLVPLLGKGGAAIREMTAAQLAGLVVTEDEIAMTEELRLALDEIEDQWTAIKNEIGLGVGGALVKGRQESERFATRVSEALAVLRAQGIEPTRQNIERMLRRLEPSGALRDIFRIRDALDALDGKTVSVFVQGYGSNYLPVGSHGSAGGYGQYVNNPDFTPGKVVEGPGGKMYIETGDPAHPYKPVDGGGGSAWAGGDSRRLERMIDQLPQMIADAVERGRR